ncbi:hypothetical protein AVEN_209722-1 [Araneus ventricosus]|uniref:Uncharacterized protein n=1 Tax=Araneus ventricosus TaxID=182803 RepID=A0A4Y2RLK8_ARAVE|nr:hypothetical protein AVEN_209722-1 [Araneus ventricosus]
MSEAICELWGSTIDKIVQKRPTTIDGDNATVETTAKRMFIYSNGAPPGHKTVKVVKSSHCRNVPAKFPYTFCKQYFPINVAVSDFKSH